MSFNSAAFLFIFLPVFIFIYVLAKGRFRLLVGIAGSLIFYAWGNFRYLPLLLTLSFGAYGVALLIDRWRGRTAAKIILRLSIALILLLLAWFKTRSGAYPLGLSYIAFQIVAYWIDAYKKADECEKDILKFLFYLLLFPKIPVGPIVRYSQVKSQIADLKIESEEMANGLRRFLKGFAKKALIADTLANVVTPIFNLQSPAIAPSIAWLVIVSYALQLYFDFSGYSDMAIGIGRMLGVRFVENFNFPYMAANISDFWRRWHISLSHWFRDYVFYPLERRRFKWHGQQINFLIVFALTGLWHGLGPTFLIWGGLHGLALAFESTALGRRFNNSWKPLQRLYTFGVIILGWVFFRSPSLSFAVNFIKRLLGDTRGIQTLPFELTSPLPFIEPTFVLALSLAILLSFPLGGQIQNKLDRVLGASNSLKFWSQILYDLCLFLIFLLALGAIASAAYRPGIYGAF